MITDDQMLYLRYCFCILQKTYRYAEAGFTILRDEENKLHRK